MRSMIEFFGLPACGKTTIMNSTLEGQALKYIRTNFACFETNKCAYSINIFNRIRWICSPKVIILGLAFIIDIFRYGYINRSSLHYMMSAMQYYSHALINKQNNEFVIISDNGIIQCYVSMLYPFRKRTFKLSRLDAYVFKNLADVERYFYIKVDPKIALERAKERDKNLRILKGSENEIMEKFTYEYIIFDTIYKHIHSIAQSHPDTIFSISNGHNEIDKAISDCRKIIKSMR